MTPTLYPWQQQAWAQLQQLKNSWPHAILLHGPQGIGKTRLAEWLAQSLLCESPKVDGQACSTCVSCGWFSQYSHPDYRRLRPACLEADDAQADSEETETKTSTKTTKTPSKEIIIDQVRSLSSFMTMSTHRQGRRVIVIYPADAMNVAAANALLKSLEEPGPNTIFILVTCSADSLLPTLISRCHQITLTLPDADQALHWLSQQLAQNKNEAEQLLAEHGGAPLAALMASESDTQGQQQDFLRYLQQPNVDGALKLADKLQKSSIPLLLSWMQRWLYDVFSYKLSGKIRYYPRYQKEIVAIASQLELSALFMLLDTTTRRRAVAEHPLSAKLVIEEMLLDYVGFCHS